MPSIHFVIICLFFKTSSCQIQCAKETLDDNEFLLNMTEHITVESGDCIRFAYELSFPANKVTVPYKKIWFEGESQTAVDVTVAHDMESRRENLFFMETDLPRGTYEYGFRLEWGCNQTYIFPKRVWISVTASNRKPAVFVPRMTEGRATQLICHGPHYCFGRANIYWKQTKADGKTIVFKDHFFRVRPFIPTADDHNTNITCVAEHYYDTVETTVTLTVEFSPKILNSSTCMTEGKLLVCVCISWGNPLPPITWPLASLTDFSVVSSRNTQTVNSTITIPAADYHNTTVKCISSNKLGQAEFEIPIQNYTENIPLNYQKDWKQKFEAVHLWITTLSFILNLILASLIIITYPRHKRVQKKLCEEMNTYALLNKAEVEQEYNVISPQCR